MNPVGQALWFIETKLDRELTLDRISAHCDMTRFGFSRLFSMNTGWPVMRYVRSRRLTRAAHALAQGAPDILQVLNPEFSRSFALLPTHLVSCRHIIFILLLTITSTISIDFPVKVPIFHVPKRILLS